MSDDRIRIKLPEGFGFDREHGIGADTLTLSRDGYDAFVTEVSRAGLYGDPVHWSAYNRMHLERNEARRERDEWKGRAERGEAALAKFPVRVMLGDREVQADHVWTDTDRAKADVLDQIAATAPVGSLVDDLKNTIVSQAREIARLKGESA